MLKGGVYAQKGTTWLKETLAALINTNASAPPGCNDLVVTVTVSTQEDALDLSCTCTTEAMPLAVNVPVPMLTPKQTQAVRTHQCCTLVRKTCNDHD